MIQLRLKTEYSFGHTFAPIGRVIDTITAQGCTAAGVVDVDGTWGHVEWHKACCDANIKPLLGVSLLVESEPFPRRMWFLAKNQDGLKELYHFTSLAHCQSIKIERDGMRPQLFKSDVLNISDNVFIFAGNNIDEQFLIRSGAIIDFNPSSRILNASKKRMGESLTFVSTSDNDYCHPIDERCFSLFSKSMIKQTPQYILESLDHQVSAKWISDQCEHYDLPIAPMLNITGDLESICTRGALERAIEWDDVYEERLHYELDLINSKNFNSYFLIVADMVRFAKQHMLVGPSRGSAAGSLVCYLAGITEIDPVKNCLFFERFIDASRSDLPDIDLDFPDSKRHMVFDYMSKKYGADNVAHIGTVSRFKPRSALSCVCKSLNIPYAASNAVRGDIILRPVADERASLCLLDTFEHTKSGQDFIKLHPHALVAAKIEGHASHTGVHAAGLIVCGDKITNYCTVTDNGIAQVDKHSAEALGLLKIDVLGLRTLHILEDAGVDIDWYNLPLDDQATFDTLNAGRLCAIFQFDGHAMRKVSRQIKFEDIQDIDAVTALARPGPLGSGVTESYIRRKNKKEIVSVHPLVEPYMRHTYGLPLYQEQTLAIVREIGKFNWKDTTAIRKAISKSLGAEFFEKYYDKFKSGALSQGMKEHEARDIWELINSMGAWQMNKAHTFSYAVVSYWTAYLKTHYPLEFAAATLRSAKDDDSAMSLLREISDEGINYVSFDINKSQANWSCQDGVLYGGFLSLKGIGENKAKTLIAARDNGELTITQKNFIFNCANPFDNIFPIRSKYAHIYDNPLDNGISSPVCFIKDIEDVPHKDDRVFISEITYKSLRNVNDDANLTKRNGVLEKDKLDYIDVRFKDDTGSIGGRISRYDYGRIGEQMLNCVPVGSTLLVRAIFFNGIRYAFIKKFKVIS